MRDRQRQGRGKTPKKQPPSSQRIWLRKLNVHVWALCQFISATLVHLHRSPDPAAFVKALIEIGKAVDKGAVPPKVGTIRAWGLFLRSFEYMQIVLPFLIFGGLARASLEDDDVKHMMRFAELALSYYEAASARTFAPRAARSERARRKIAATRAQLHISIAIMYERFGLDDMSRDFEIAFTHYDEAQKILEDEGSDLSKLAIAHVLTSRADDQLVYPIENRIHYVRQAVEALLRAREIVEPLAGSTASLPPWLDDPKAWNEMDFMTKVKSGAPHAARLAAARRSTSVAGTPDPVTARTSIPPLMARIDWQLGRAYRLVGELEKAIEHFKFARTEFVGAGSDLLRIGIDVDNGYALLESPQGDRRQNTYLAAKSFGAALAAFREQKSLTPLLEKTRLLSILGDAKACLELYELKALTPEQFKKTMATVTKNLRIVAGSARSHALIPELQEALFLLGRIYALQNDVTQSYQSAALAARVADRLQRRARTPRVGHFLAGTRAEIDDLLVRISLMILGLSEKQPVEQGEKPRYLSIISVFCFSERARTVFLGTQLANLKLVPHGAARDGLEDLFERRRLWHAAELRLMEHESNPTADGKTLDAIRQQRDLLESRYRSELEKARATYGDPDYDPDTPFLNLRFLEFHSIASPFLQERKAALVEYHLNSRWLNVFVLFPDSIMYEEIDISIDELKAIQTRWEEGQRRLREIDPCHWDRGYLGQVLDRLQPAVHAPAKAIGEWEQKTGRRIEQIIVVPHRFLHLVPLHVVPLPDGTAWGDSVSIQYVPSASVLLQLLRSRSAQTSAPVGNPSERNGRKAVVISYSPPSNSKERPLLFHSDEAHAVVAATGGQLLEGQEATPSRARTAMQDATYIHFVCHGTFDENAPLESELKLAAEDGPDGTTNNQRARMTLGTIFESVRLTRAPLVVLSACETGLTKVEERHDEYIGLPAGFLYAGASTVVSTLWRVPDIATWLLMRDFTGAVADGCGPVVALARAQRNLRGLSRASVIEEITKAAGKESDSSLRERMLQQARELPQTEFPFAGPFWWAAFTVNGLG